MSLKIRTVSFVALAAVAAALLVAMWLNPEPSTAAEVEQNLDAIMANLESGDSQDTMAGFSSNPYDYVTNNENYDQIVAAGYDALPVLESELRSTQESGLREYIICVAIEDITNCNLKQFDDSQWDRAENFKVQWDTYLKDMPSKVDGIMRSDSTAAEKREAIVALGAPAVPYVLAFEDSIDEETRAEVAIAIRQAMGDADSDESMGEFARSHAADISVLQDYVETR